MAVIENIIKAISPSWALRRLVARKQHERLYDAAKPSNHYRRVKGVQSPDGVMDHARDKLRAIARHLDENHDIAIGVLDSLVNNTVGAKGITLEPQIKTRGGKLNQRANEIVRNAWANWTKQAEVSQHVPWGELQRLVCRTWLRDGEVLVQHVQGNVLYQFPTNIPYALETIEADYLPFDLSEDNRQGPRVVHGIEMNQWRQPIGYHLYKGHPDDRFFNINTNRDTKRVPAELISHIKFTRRLNQARGISVLHGVINRLEDIKDYEESERIAARVAASFTAYIRKNMDSGPSATGAAGERSFCMEPGMVWDNLMPGEEVGTIEANRPNSGLEAFRDSQVRAVASGTGSTYSTIAKNYNGTYSSQRQELVEAQPGYERLRNYFISAFIDPVYQNFIQIGIASGSIQLPRNIDRDTLLNYEARGQGMPWIDPKKESEADELAVQNRFKSRHQVIRDRGGDPAMVDQQIQLELEYDQANGLTAPTQEAPNPPSTQDLIDNAIEEAASA